ncbi:sulfotransferase [Sphingomonas koreensis]|nr:sulfotransferase [Sphingomonas koreensis]
MEDTTPFFVFGAPRSGTSLLTRIINAHPEIGIPFETQFYRDFYPLRGSYGDLERPENRERLVDHLLAGSHVSKIQPLPSRDSILGFFTRHDMHGSLEALMRAWLAPQNKKRWGEKTPTHTRLWCDVLAGFPNAKIICIVRDGRDAALSWKQATFGPKHYLPLAERWADYAIHQHACRAALPADQFLQIRYEELVSDTEAVTRTLCRFLGADFFPAMLSFHERSVHYPTDSRNMNNLTQPVLSANTDKWRAGMSSRDLRIFEAIAGQALSSFGYKRANPDAAIGTVERARMKFVDAPAAKALDLSRKREARVGALNLVRMKMLKFRLAPTRLKHLWDSIQARSR